MVRSPEPITVIHVEGDMVTTTVGDHAQNVVAGKNIVRQMHLQRQSLPTTLRVREIRRL